ncbi:hypothetical protein [uncultured Brevundimonas sp.]|uniref:hypothetical protein n=1 Tax=uncultured Brevundimonas sp. TaxID=213418 RepID=UPI0030EEEEF4
MTFSATEAAFEGFRLVRRRPLTVVFWWLVYVAVFGALFAVAGTSLPGMMVAVQEMEGKSDPSTAELMALGRTFLGVMSLAMPLGLLASTVLNAAVARAVVRPAESGWGYLRIGMDELRVLGVSLVLGLAFILIEVVCFGLLGLLTGLTRASGIPMMWVVVVLAGFAAVAFLVWLMVRFSLAIPIVVAERRWALFESFALTRGHFWPLLGMALLAWVMTMLVALLGGIAALPVTLTTGGLKGLAAYDGLSALELVQVAAPAILGWVVINAILSALQLAVMYAPFSAAYRGLKGLPDAD